MANLERLPSTGAHSETSTVQSVASRLVPVRYESNYKTVVWSALPPIRLFPRSSEPRSIVESSDARHRADGIACPLAATDRRRCESACASVVATALHRSCSAMAPQDCRRRSLLLYLAYSLLVGHHTLHLDKYRPTALGLGLFC